MFRVLVVLMLKRSYQVLRAFNTDMRMEFYIVLVLEALFGWVSSYL